jgi:hypothetical protein
MRRIARLGFAFCLLFSVPVPPTAAVEIEFGPHLDSALFLKPSRLRVHRNSIAYWLVGLLPPSPSTRVAILGADGVPRIESSLNVEGAARVSVSSVAPFADGRAAVAFGLIDASGAIVRGFGVLESGGAIERYVRIDDFIPLHIEVDDEGAVWLFGQNLGDPADGLTLQKYTAEGKLVGRFLPRSEFHSETPPAIKTGAGGVSHLACSSDNVFVYSGPSGRLVELSLSGEILRNIWLPFFEVSHLTVASNGRVFASGYGNGKPGGLLYELDFELGDWKPVPGWDAPGAPGNLLGIVADKLVFSDPGNPAWLVRTAVPER